MSYLEKLWTGLSETETGQFFGESHLFLALLKQCFDDWDDEGVGLTLQPIQDDLVHALDQVRVLLHAAARSANRKNKNKKKCFKLLELYISLSIGT